MQMACLDALQQTCSVLSPPSKTTVQNANTTILDSNTLNLSWRHAAVP